MRSNTWILGFTLAAALSSAASASDISIFGLELGKPFALPECGSSGGTYLLEHRTVCYERMDYSPGKGIRLSQDTVHVGWPESKKPDLLPDADASLRATIINGTLERLEFGTLGYESQQRDLAALTEKFGTPSAISKPILQNSFGATAQAIRAEWRVGDITVTYDSMTKFMGWGSVNIETAKSAANRKTIADNSHAAKQKL
jgi:hypothetical protein